MAAFNDGSDLIVYARRVIVLEEVAYVKIRKNVAVEVTPSNHSTIQSYDSIVHKTAKNIIVNNISIANIGNLSKRTGSIYGKNLVSGKHEYLTKPTSVIKIKEEQNYYKRSVESLPIHKNLSSEEKMKTIMTSFDKSRTSVLNSEHIFPKKGHVKNKVEYYTYFHNRKFL
ncbi:uncharacterized protein LOC126900796 isoform X2 [Daktulosphaira vitifoliae]|nr:uncharacterized protein LOC126900796 isoform X2 [Daktulosphaira vitifoliae]XP_050532691.1 uncharacterized protein LOC126900796 isoform X2 [Daktulosphaira vitifoliae]XP_050532692.1 uncharacterized protein LOC126900796 isoform X2 [Daktulosphaira vitifoliae]XP_050532693.1 uncharacterized protein LOC126900796 isoform X2 [Daktulosphaira vitifoliae]